MIEMIYVLDFLILIILSAGLFYTMLKYYNIKVSNRKLALFGMYFFYFMYIGLDFFFDHSLNITDAFLSLSPLAATVYLGKRIVLVLFTLLAIPWSSGFDFWDKKQ